VVLPATLSPSDGAEDAPTGPLLCCNRAMSWEEGRAEIWLARGVEAYQQQHFTEAATHFEKAVALDPGSAPAHLALGVARLTLYQKRPAPPSPDWVGARRDITEAELRAYREQEQALLAEQNATNWARAEESLQRARQLDPQNQLILEYLGALYCAWKDPFEEENHRLAEARSWLARLAALNPEHPSAHWDCGRIACQQAQRLLHQDGRFPPPPEMDEDRRARRTNIGPLLAEATRHLGRALARNPKHGGALRRMAQVKAMEASLAETAEMARQKQEESAEWKRKAQRISEAALLALGEPVWSGSSATITFRPRPAALTAARAQPFPPNPWWI
jgi:tetratricopeptide (TPR) repeat protein